jgi:hypothetical protein
MGSAEAAGADIGHAMRAVRTARTRAACAPAPEPSRVPNVTRSEQIPRSPLEWISVRIEVLPQRGYQTGTYIGGGNRKKLEPQSPL